MSRHREDLPLWLSPKTGSSPSCALSPDEKEIAALEQRSRMLASLDNWERSRLNSIARLCT